MKVGVGLPTYLRGVEPDLVYDWARLADVGPFSSLGTGELITTPCYDALTALTAAGAVTTRVRLMTSVLVVPLHNAGLLAKQTATIDKLTGGRLTLGIGIGGKKPILFGITGDEGAHSNFPDYDAAPAPYAGRAARFDEQIDFMKRIWRGEAPAPGVPPVGPAPATQGGPELLIGGFDERAIARAARVAQGLTIFDHGPDVDKIAQQLQPAPSRLGAGRAEPSTAAGGIDILRARTDRRRGQIRVSPEPLRAPFARGSTSYRRHHPTHRRDCPALGHQSSGGDRRRRSLARADHSFARPGRSAGCPAVAEPLGGFRFPPTDVLSRDQRHRA